ncbi:hypothetical protein Syun_001874 [Stephania yunnanensis]|uniref:Protein SirB1 N-terminal domain-containing protein n=1 Tax=Stephania yunnanensis TaxID=152371 RepID=A0AAP0Q887_9MAGN
MASATLTSSSSSVFTSFHKSPLRPSTPLRFVCKSQTLDQDQDQDQALPLVLHDALDASGLDTKHVRAAREGFRSQIGRLGAVERDTSISVNRRIDLAKTALYIAAEDDSLISHSSVPLPVDAFVDRLDDLSMGFCSHYGASVAPSSPEAFLGALERFLYQDKGFRRAKVSSLSDPRALYLHSVLTHRSGSAVMLSLIYAELLKMLRLWSLLSFDVEIYCPHDLVSLPRGYNKKKSRVSDQPHILTTQALLVKMLKNLKDAFWPFQNDPTKSLFLRAAHAARCTSGPTNMGESGFERASAKAAQHRLERGVWTSVRLGDMRRALSACERLIQMEFDLDELRDYSILLYHCGFYEESMQYMKAYLTSRADKPLNQEGPSKALRDLEDEAVEKLMMRLNLISMEDTHTRPSYFRSFLSNCSEPW